MVAPPIPRTEGVRKRTLDALNILDSLPEAFSEAIATAAAAIANVPVSAITLVDSERQWFKGSCGLDVNQTSRDVSFCAHAILGSAPFLIPDALADPRFCKNPLVLGSPYIRAYAGFPLFVDGQAVGALCVIDDQPRQLSKDQLERLSRLAAGTAAWLTERQSLRSSLDRTKDELQYITLNDSVTGLPNRLVFQDRLKQAASRCAAFSVLLVDIDGFKHLNELWGEAGGDGVLRELGARLQKLVAPSGGIVARSGGDQFLLLTDEATTADVAARLAEVICNQLGQPIGEPERSRLTVSIGISLFPTDGEQNRLVANANAAMINAKRAGGNGYRFFEAQLEADARAKVTLLQDLRHAIRLGELDLHYQPKIHALSGQVTGVEALLRWQHPKRGNVSPAIFIPIAERFGLINDIGRWVIAQACRQMHVWCAAGIRMRVAINISVHQLGQPTFAEEISTELSSNGVEPSLLTCEITESVAMNDAATSLQIFHKLRAVGVFLSIDDFGTGYSSLSYLRKLPVHQLKIDRSFVSDLEESEDARAVAAAIINLGHALRMEVVAEGVETQEQCDLLVGMGCDKLQGFLFAKPMTSDAFTEWTAERAEGRPTFRPSIFAIA